MRLTAVNARTKKLVTLAFVGLAMLSAVAPVAAHAEGFISGPGGTLDPTETTDAGRNNTNDSQEQANGDKGIGENILERILGGVIAPFTGLSYVFLAVANGLLFVAGSLLNWVFIGTVLEFSQNFGNSEGLLIAWGIMRDLGNIFLLFGFVFIGISTILGLQTYAAKKTLPRLILFAILLNFSLFVAEFVIDITNAVSTVLYNQAGIAELCQYNLESATDLRSIATLEHCSENIGLSGVIFNASGLAGLEPPPFWTTRHQSGWWDLTGLARDAWDNMNVTNQLHIIQVMIGLTLFSFVAMVVFIAASIMLLIRAVVLTLLMVTAPLGFAGTVVPFLGKISRDWWHNLINQSFFAPAFILLVLVGLKIIESTGLNDGTTIVSALSSGDVSSMQVISLFALVIGFMVAALIVAKKFGAYGADTAATFAFKAGSTGMGYFTGGAARILRAGLQSRAGQTLTGPLGRYVVNAALRPTETGAIGIHKIPGIGGILGAAGVKDAAPFKGFESHRQITETQPIRTRLKQAQAEYDREIEGARIVDSITNNRPLSAADYATLTSMSAEELRITFGSRLVDVMPHITESQYEGLMSSANLSEAQKEKLRERRVQRIIDAIKAGDKDKVRRFSANELAEALRTESASGLLRDISTARLVSDDQARALASTNKFTDEQKRVWEESRESRFSASEITQTIQGMSESEFSTLHPKFLSRQEVLDAASLHQLAAIDPRTLDQKTFDFLQNYIRTHTLTINNNTQTIAQHIDNLRMLNPSVAQRWGGRT